MKHHALFFSKDKSKKKIKCCLLQFLLGALRVDKPAYNNIVVISAVKAVCIGTSKDQFIG